MNRVIKFRAFLNDGHWAIDNYGQMIYDYTDKILFESLGFWSDDVCYMQFTSLVDKNGVEIYCDDILDNGKLVYWSNEQACYFCGDNPLCMSNSHRAIIGNIHEHKHLLI